MKWRRRIKSAWLSVKGLAISIYERLQAWFCSPLIVWLETFRKGKIVEGATAKNRIDVTIKWGVRLEIVYVPRGKKRIRITAIDEFTNEYTKERSVRRVEVRIGHWSNEENKPTRLSELTRLEKAMALYTMRAIHKKARKETRILEQEIFTRL